MNKNVKIILAIIAILLFLMIFIRPLLVKMYCERVNDTRSRNLLDDLATRQVNDITTYDQNNLSMGNEITRAKDMQILNNKYENEFNQDKGLLNQWYEECLHRWGE